MYTRRFTKLQGKCYLRTVCFAIASERGDDRRTTKYTCNILYARVRKVDSEYFTSVIFYSTVDILYLSLAPTLNASVVGDDVSPPFPNNCCNVVATVNS